MRAMKSLKICTLMGCFCQKVYNVWAKENRGVVPWKLTYGFKNDLRNSVNFHTSSWK